MIRVLICLFLVVQTPAYAQVDELFRAWDTNESPGVAVAVLYRGTVLHHEGYGIANLEHSIPITPTSVFDVASVSKQFCAFAITLLVDEGRIALDDDIRTYMPELPDFGHTITLRHLLHHTSGLRDWPGMLAMAGRNMEDVISMEEITAFIKHQRTLNFVPGTQYSYSNTGYTILALLIERLSGQSFRTFTEERIFAPLDMTQTHFQDDHEEIIPGRVVGYASQFGKIQRIGNGLMALGSSSLHTTTEDLLKWVQNFEDQKIGSPAVHAMMNSQGQLDDGTEIPYGFGLVRGSYRGLNTVSHSGGWAGFRTVILRIPDHEFTAIVLSNSAIMNAPAMAQRIAEHYLDAFMSPPNQPPVTAEDVPPLNDFAGVYDFGKASVLRLISRGESLLAHWPPTPPVSVQPIGVDSLRVPALNLTITFTRDSSGSIVNASTRGLNAARLSPSEDTSLSMYEGCYTSEELGVSYSVSAQDTVLVASDPRGKKLTFTKTVDHVFVGDTWFAPVIRMEADKTTRTVTHFEANNARSLHVRFVKGC
jgi:CubicO group peptidase (beta-lactamase class C family)